MIAPCCVICKRWAREAGGSFIQFKIVDPKEIEHNAQFSNPGGLVPPGHPVGNYFFCTAHSGLGLKYKHLTWSEAEPLIREAFENDDIPKPPIKYRVLGVISKIIDRFLNKN